MYFTSRKPSVDFVQGAFLELLINSDLSFELKLEQKIAVNCFLEGSDVSVRVFFSAVLHCHRTEKDFEKESIQTV